MWTKGKIKKRISELERKLLGERAVTKALVRFLDCELNKLKLENKELHVKIAVLKQIKGQCHVD